ncbi:MAG: hypothetical protein KJ587_20080 [Alphaproteobacteria bacterium]|nr:hypothetical protein [Alphaproteobacteria bacterium]
MKEDYLDYEHTLIDHRKRRGKKDNERPIKFKKKVKRIVFHKDFKKGTRLWLCKNCGYPSYFMGVPMIMCECDNPKGRVYTLDKLEDFILELQNIFFRKKKEAKN